MIGIKDLKTEAGEAEFARCRESVKRFMLSKGCSPEEADEIAQITVTRVWEKIIAREGFQVNCGYFIETAKFVLKEFYRERKKQWKYYYYPDDGDDEATTEIPDAEKQFKKFNDESHRAILSDCQLECFGGLTPDEQVLMWRYYFDDKYRLDEEESDAYNDFLASILHTLRDIRDYFLSIQDEHSPINKKVVRGRVHRIRERLKECVKNCISRKKGFS